MRKILFLFLCCIMFISCGLSTKQNDSYRYSFLEYSSIFNDSLLNHFPKKVDSLYAFYHCRSKNDTNEKEHIFKRNSLILVNIVSDNIKDSVKKITAQCKEIIFPNDSCNVIVNMFNNGYSDSQKEFDRHLLIKRDKNFYTRIDSILYKMLKYRQDKCSSLHLPIPNFHPLYFYNIKITNGNRLTNDFIIYVLDAQKGHFLPEEYLTKGLGMPKGWRNGFSKGIAISDDRNIIIYWIEVW